MLSGKVVRVLVALGLAIVGVDAHRHGLQHQHHKRGSDSCECVPVVTTTWVPYVPSDWTTSTMTLVQTHYIFVDVEDTMTVTYTDEITEIATVTAGWKEKRGEPTDSSCFETVITTWVEYEPKDFVIPSYESTVVPKSSKIKSHKPSHKSSAPPSSSPTPTSTYVPPATVAPVIYSATPSPSYTAPEIKPEYNAAAVVVPHSSSPAPPPAATASAVVSPPSGGLYALTYTPYDSTTGACKSASSILSDLSEIQGKGFPRLRLYSVDCNTLSLVATPAIKMGFKLTIGVFFDATGLTRANADLTAILEWAQWENVEVVNIGNEAVSQGFVSASALASFIGTATTKLRAAGFNGIVSTAETVATFQNNPSICTCLSSIVHANIHGYFDPNCAATDAGTFVLNQISLVQKACGGKQVIVSESGWPSGGPNNGDAMASSSAQASAIASLRAITGQALITFFSFTNDLWKAAGVEQNFGCGQYF